VKIRTKLGLALVAVAVLPAAISGVTAVTISSSAMTRATDAAHRRTAGDAAQLVSRFLEEAERALRIGVTYAEFADLSDEERRGALTILYLQLDALTAVALVDRSGQGLVPTVYRTPEEGDDRQLARHEAVTPAGHAAFAERIPVAEALSAGIARSVPYDAEAGRRLVMAVAVDGAAGARWVVASEVSLRDVEGNLRLAAPTGGRAELVDGGGRILVSSRSARPSGRVDDLWLTGRERAERFRDGAQWHRGAVAIVDGTPWRVVVRRPESVALASTHRMRAQALLWTGVGVAIALLLGFVLAGGLTDPVRRLADAARRIAGGDLSTRAAVPGKDEIALLGRAFDEMAAEIEKKRDEIEAWNRELSDRVEARTREIADLQGVLQRSQRMAAVAALGAGVAHEINNPLTGVLGFTQLLRRKIPEGAPERTMLDSIEEQAIRIREIVSTLMRLTEDESGRKSEAVDVVACVRECLELHAGRHAEQKIVVATSLDAAPAVEGSRADLRQAVLHVLDNAREAMPEGGTLSVEVAYVEGAVRVRIADTGRGIPKEHLERVFDPFFTSKQGRWEAKGLGLTVTHRIVEEHGGRTAIASEVGKGTTVTITLPALLKGSLLE